MELRKVDILGKKYKVTNKPDKDLGDIDGLYMGLFMGDRDTIFLNPDLREGEEYWTTLLHEIGHGVIHRSGVRFSGGLTPEIEEIIVETMANVNYNLIKLLLRKVISSGDIIEIRDEVRAFSRGISKSRAISNGVESGESQA